MKVIILRGIPGAGKSTWIEKNIRIDHRVVSADHHFVDPETGGYKFDPTQLGVAHARCLRKFVQHLEDLPQSWTVVVDNTNTTAVEISPYYALAEAFRCDVEIVTLHCDPDVAARRNVHGVPGSTVYPMDRRLRAEVLPPRWRNTEIQL